MAITRYRDFVLLAEVVAKDVQGIVSQFSVQVFDAPAGQGEKKEIVTLPDDLALRARSLEKHQLEGNVAGQIDLGETLAGLLFPPYARQKLAQSLLLLQEKEGLRLRLRLADELSDYPWEYLYIQDVRGEKTASSFLALDPRLSIVREQVLSVPPDAASLALKRVLVAMAAPAPYPALPGLALEQQAIQRTLAQLPGVQVKCLPDFAASGDAKSRVSTPAHGASLQDLGGELMLGEHTDVFHFSGHGTFASEPGAALGSLVGQGYILLADAANQAVPLSADRLGELLRSQGVRLVVLGACETARRDNVHIWSSVAASLLKARIPAVVAMQFKISDPAAVAFSGTLYQALAAGYPLDYAVAAGRLAIRSAVVAGDSEWGVPALYLRSGIEMAFKPVEDPQAAQNLEQALVQVESSFTRIEPQGRVVGARVRDMSQGAVLVDLQVDERVSGEVTGARIESMQGGRLHVKEKAGVVDGMLIGAEIGMLGGTPAPASKGPEHAPAIAGEVFAQPGTAPRAATCTNCGRPLEAGARFCSNCGTPVKAPAALEAGQPGAPKIDVRQDAGKVEDSQVAGNVLAGGATPGVSSNIEQKMDTVGHGGIVVGSVIGGKDAPIHFGGQQQYGDTVQGNKVSTGGGAFIAGGVTTGGDFVGRDKHVYGDEVRGDKVQGDKFDVKVSGSTGVAIGRNAQAYVNQGVSGELLAAMFAIVYRRIDERPEDNRADRDELRETAQRVEKEMSKGEQANPDKLDRWLQTLENVAPDVVEVAVNTLLNPGSGAASVVRKVLERFRKSR